MNGVVETRDRLRNMSYMGLAFKQVMLVEPCSNSGRHIVIISKRRDGTWLINLIDKRPVPAVVRELVTHDDEQAIEICGLITSSVAPVELCDRALEHVDDADGTVSADQSELIATAMRMQASAA